MNDTIIIEKRNIAHIPCLHAKPQDVNDAPAVIVYHGWGSIKEHYRFFAEMLARFGFQAIVPDAPLHGERGMLPAYHSAEGYQHWWDVIIQGVEDAGLLLQEIDASRVSVFGSSMGGLMASGVFAAHPQVRTLINMNGAPAWEVTENAFRAWEGKTAAEEVLAPIRPYDPMQKLDSLNLRPILLMHGANDSAMPIDGQRAFYEAAAPLYASAPDRLRFEVVRNLNHHITLGMMEEAVEWLRLHG